MSAIKDNSTVLGLVGNGSDQMRLKCMEFFPLPGKMSQAYFSGLLEQEGHSPSDHPLLLFQAT